MRAGLVHILGGMVSVYLAPVVEIGSPGLTAALQLSDAIT